MRKHFLILLALMLGSLLVSRAQISVTIYGQVTDQSGNPVPNHQVLLIPDTTQGPVQVVSAYTNNSGYYLGAVSVPAVSSGGVGFVQVITASCNGAYLTDSAIYTNFLTTDTVNFQICVYTSSCVASIQHTALSGSGFSFTGTVSGTANPFIIWEMGDSSTYINTLSVTHTYPTTGLYIVTLSVYDTLTQCYTTVHDSVWVSSTAGATCYPGFYGSFNPSNTVVSFQNFSYSTSGNPLTYAWTFSNGASSTLTNPVLYNASAPLSACLTITDTLGGCSATYCDIIQPYYPPACAAAFQYSILGHTVTFTDYSTFSTPSGGGQYLWSFGDGDSSTLQNPVYTYAADGVYQVCLTITDTSGCSHTFCDYVYLTPLGTGYTLNGQVTTLTPAGNQPTDSAIVYLITLDPATLSLTAIDSVTVWYADSGIYAFYNLAPGAYTVKAALLPGSPAFSSYLPTYYGDTLFWIDANWVSIPSGPMMYNIHLVPGTNPGGPGFIGGLVSAGANKQGKPMAQVPVLLLDADQDPVAVTWSAADGTFSFSNVALGNYLVYVDMLNHTTDPVPVSLTASSASATGLEIEVSARTISYTGSEGNALDQHLSAVYPNPTADQAALDLALDQTGILSIEILSVMGQPLAAKTLTLPAGKHALTLETRELPAGVYLVRVRDNAGATAIRRIVKN